MGLFVESPGKISGPESCFVFVVFAYEIKFQQDAIAAYTWASLYHAYVRIFWQFGRCECHNVVN